jgi:hypothetical protein
MAHGSDVVLGKVFINLHCHGFYSVREVQLVANFKKLLN